MTAGILCFGIYESISLGTYYSTTSTSFALFVSALPAVLDISISY